MKYRGNPLLKDMLGSPVIKPRCNKVLQIRCTEEEKTMYDELMDMDIDIPYMMREFVRELHGKVK